MRVGNGMCVGDGMRIGNARASGDPAMPLHKASAPAGTSRRISQHSGRPHTIGTVAPAR